ncbi:hypothetical protein DFH09DRAFT_1122043 [Mycena vulgaris]|nr:hypothetical protein DFH09DRAFT_1122043 [Mycena vulgaris]
MSPLALKWIVFLSAGLAAAYPVLTSVENANTKSDSVPPDLNVLRVKSRAIDIADAVQSGQGNQLFASEHWKKSMTRIPTRVRESRDPETTIFNHIQWDEGTRSPDLEDAPISLLFAHNKWDDQEARGETRRVHDDQTEDGHHTDFLYLLQVIAACLIFNDNPVFRNELQNRKSAQRRYPTQELSRAEVAKQWERRETTGLDVSKRNDTSTGPIFFAKVQWDE